MSLARIFARTKYTPPKSHADEIADLIFFMREEKAREIRTAEALEQFNVDKPK